MSSRSTLDFLKTETGSGVILALAAALAIGWANSPWADAYFAFVGQPLTLQVGGFADTMPVLDWVKTGLMPIFFFVVGLEIKYEILRGELSNPRRLALPLLAAAGGIVVPAVVYLGFNLGPGGRPEGWPTSTATDIAFALAALSIAAPRAPPSLRIFLLTLAIADDAAAVFLIAVFYVGELHTWMVLGMLGCLALMAALSRWSRAPYFFYALAFALLWAFALKSGVNTSLAAVVAAMTVRVEPRRPGAPSVLNDFMVGLHPYVAFFVLPLFAFTAAGFSLSRMPPGGIFDPAPLGVAAGLFLGKQIGVFGAAALAVGLKLARRPTGARWLELYGVSILCGIGFTISLFIGSLAFNGDSLAQSQAQLGVTAGSALSALMGMIVLALARAWRDAAEKDQV